jgi:hypothetical protein
VQKRFGRLTISRFRQIEIDGVAVAVHGTEQIHPPSGDPNVGFIHMPGGGRVFQLSS